MCILWYTQHRLSICYFFCAFSVQSFVLQTSTTTIKERAAAAEDERRNGRPKSHHHHRWLANEWMKTRERKKKNWRGDKWKYVSSRQRKKFRNVISDWCQTSQSAVFRWFFHRNLDMLILMLIMTGLLCACLRARIFCLDSFFAVAIYAHCARPSQLRIAMHQNCLFSGVGNAPTIVEKCHFKNQLANIFAYLALQSILFFHSAIESHR